jgi:hypothetical protein
MSKETNTKQKKAEVTLAMAFFKTQLPFTSAPFLLGTLCSDCPFEGEV